MHHAAVPVIIGYEEGRDQGVVVGIGVRRRHQILWDRTPSRTVYLDLLAPGVPFCCFESAFYCFARFLTRRPQSSIEYRINMPTGCLGSRRTAAAGNAESSPQVLQGGPNRLGWTTSRTRRVVTIRHLRLHQDHEELCALGRLGRMARSQMASLSSLGRLGDTE